MHIQHVIELSKFKPTKIDDGWGYSLSQPFSIAFVYCQSGNKFVVKGFPDEVRNWIDANAGKCIYYMSYWKKGESRGGWSSTCKLYLFSKKIRGRMRIEVSLINQKRELKKIGEFRRVPLRWLVIYNEAVSG